jgi:SAM-dependent methyltransferase
MQTDGVADQHYAADQRLAFGRVAELYDRARPTYPDAAVDAVIHFGALAPPMRILEVGAGTGKATALLADRGLGVLALEPSPDMARVARANCARYPEVEIIETEFEPWVPPERLPACVSVQAWHWIAPEVRYQKAHQALLAGGTLAAIWMLPDWDRCALRASLSKAYRATVPDLVADFPMHPDSEPTRLAGDWHGEIAASGRFSGPVVTTYPWSRPYSSSAYAELVQTHQDHILIAEVVCAELLRAVTRTIDDAGGTLELPFMTYVCLATRA